MNSLRIAFVSSSTNMRRFRRDASFIYRCENLALAMHAMGHKADLLHITTLMLNTNYDVVVFLRPSMSWQFKYVVKRLRARGATLIGDVDDLIFDPAYAKFRPAVRNELEDLTKTREKFIAHARALQEMDAVHCSTKALAEHYLALHPERQCKVVPNAPHRSWDAICPSGKTPPRSISYFSGTRTHDRDLAIVAPVLGRLLERHQDLAVQLVGPVSADLHHPRVHRVEKVDFDAYARLVSATYLCIAPLEDTPFNRCKSALKAMEAGAMNVPTVASSIGEYAEICVDGLLKAGSVEEWESQLEFALDRANHERLSTGLRDRMRNIYQIDEIAAKCLAGMSPQRAA
jgi:glycosyltransferase involved in cell wall biosynthesis